MKKVKFIPTDNKWQHLCLDAGNDNARCHFTAAASEAEVSDDLAASLLADYPKNFKEIVTAAPKQEKEIKEGGAGKASGKVINK